MNSNKVKALLESLVIYFEYDGVIPSESAYGDECDAIQNEIDIKVDAINDLAIEILKYK